jgi:hypothetical protein
MNNNKFTEVSAMSREKAEVMDGKAMSRATARIAYEIIERGHGAENVCIVGIRRRGAVIAKHDIRQDSRYRAPRDAVRATSILHPTGMTSRSATSTRARRSCWSSASRAGKSCWSTMCSTRGARRGPPSRPMMEQGRPTTPAARGAYRQRPQGAADKPGLCRQKCSHVAQRDAWRCV